MSGVDNVAPDINLALSQQEPIATTSVRRFRRAMRLVVGAVKCSGFSMIVIFYGRSGIGKSMAIQYFLDSLFPRAHTGLPAAIMITIEDEWTSKELAEGLLRGIGEAPKGRNRWKVLDEVVSAIVRNDIDLIILDEANRLNERTFQFARSLIDKCDVYKHPIVLVLVGTAGILQVVKTRETFDNRVGSKHAFLAPEPDEMIATVFPNLRIPRWRFNPDDPEHEALGRALWAKLQPALRRVRNVLALASQVAFEDGEPYITEDHIDEALLLLQRNRLNESEKEGLDDVEEDIQDETSKNKDGDDRKGALERESEERHAAKQRKKEKSKSND